MPVLHIIMVVLGLTVIFGGVLYYYFKTKQPGFGPFNTSTLITLLVLYVGALAFFTGELSGGDLSKILFALIGFAAGLFTRPSKG